MRKERKKDGIAYFLRALPTSIDIHMLSNAYTTRFSTTYPYSLDISTFTAISSNSIRLTSERFLNNKNYLCMGFLSYIFFPFIFYLFSQRDREANATCTREIRRRWRVRCTSSKLFQKLLLYISRMDLGCWLSSLNRPIQIEICMNGLYLRNDLIFFILQSVCTILIELIWLKSLTVILIISIKSEILID